MTEYVSVTYNMGRTRYVTLCPSSLCRCGKKKRRLRAGRFLSVCGRCGKLKIARRGSTRIAGMTL